MKRIKIVTIILIIMMLFITAVSPVYASIEDTPDDLKVNPPGLSINPDDYKPENQQTANNATELKIIGQHIMAIIMPVAVITSVIVFVILGIKYMAGSVEERAGYKKSLVPYLIGAVLVFGITSILTIIVNIVGEIT